MMATTTATRKISPFGIEVDADLRDLACHAEVKRLFEEHGLLVFRNQDLTMDQQRAVMNRLGPVLDDIYTVGYVSNTCKDGILGDSEVSFHSDFIYMPEPLLGLSLHAIDVQYEQSWTRFASCTRALEALPGALRTRIENMSGLNLFLVLESLKGRQRLAG